MKVTTEKETLSHTDHCHYLWYIVNTREIAESNGRGPYDIKFFVQFTPILGDTVEDAQAKFEQYKKYAIPGDGLALFGGTSGIGISKFPWDKEFLTDPEHPLMRQFTPI